MTFKLVFGGRKYEIEIIPTSETGYTIELFTKDRITGDEFQKLRQYLIDEGYVDRAFDTNLL